MAEARRQAGAELQAQAEAAWQAGGQAEAEASGGEALGVGASILIYVESRACWCEATVDSALRARDAAHRLEIRQRGAAQSLRRWLNLSEQRWLPASAVPAAVAAATDSCPAAGGYCHRRR